MTPAASLQLLLTNCKMAPFFDVSDGCENRFGLNVLGTSYTFTISFSNIISSSVTLADAIAWTTMSTDWTGADIFSLLECLINKKESKQIPTTSPSSLSG